MAGDSSSKTSIGSQWALVSLAALVLGARLTLKISRAQKGAHWADDVLLATAFCCLVTASILRTMLLNISNSRDLTPDQVIRIGLFGAVAGILAHAGAMLSKTSFCFTLLRIVTGRTKRMVWFVAGSMSGVIVLSVILLVVQCKPVDASWNSLIKGDCWPGYITFQYGIFSSAYSAAMDFVIVAIVWSVIIGLQMKKMEKYAVAVGMSMGIFAGMAGIVKTVYLHQLNFPKLFIWENAEMSLTIIAACIPVLRVFFVKKVSSFISNMNGRSRNLGTGPTGVATGGRSNGFQVMSVHDENASSDAKSESFILSTIPPSKG